MTIAATPNAIINEGADEAGKAYARFSALSRLLAAPSLDPAHRSMTGLMTLRAALHPALRPYFWDPLLPLAGEYISLDAQTAAIAALLEPDVFAFLSREDCAILTQAGIFAPASPPSPAPLPMVGALWGALWVPGREMAVACRVCVAFDRAAVFPSSWSGWPPPLPVRPMGEMVVASACRALRAAVSLLTCDGLLPAGLVPAPLYFDICAPDLDNATQTGIAGDSLDLPLALAFLSALQQVTLPAGLAATGALRSDASGEEYGAVSEVGWVEEKGAAVRAAAPDRAIFLVPASAYEEGDSAAAFAPVWDLRTAAAAADLWHSPTIIGASELINVPSVLCMLFPQETAGEGVFPLAHLLSKIMGRFGGERFVPHDNEGANPAYFAVFGSATHAVHAALAVAQAFQCQVCPDADTALTGVMPSLAVHAAAESDTEATAAQAERIAEGGAPGRVLVSAFARNTGGETMHWVPLGTHRLRDLRPPLALWEATWRDSAGESPLSPTLTQRLHHLPVQTLPLFGREAERSALRRLLRDPAARLVTVTGAGGCGKTRLVLEAAAASAGDFEGGVHLVSLAEARSGEEAAAAIAAALHLVAAPHARATTTELVMSALSLVAARLLLVLDNAEGSRALESTAPGIPAFIAELLRVAPRVVCFAAARNALQVPGETVFSVPPLSAPPEVLPSDEAECAFLVPLFPAAALFLARARAVRPDFTPPSEWAEWNALAQLCRHFAAAPLALTLAASWAGEFPLSQLARLLIGNGVAARSPVAAALEGTSALLAPPERDFLGLLACFAGGFTPESAEAVAAAPEFAADYLSLLEEKGFLQRGGSGGEETPPVVAARFYLPPPVRDFALRRLGEGPGQHTARAAHTACFERLASDTQRMADSDREVAAFDRLSAERDNLRTAFEFLRDEAAERLPLFVYHLADFLHYREPTRAWRDWPRLAVRLVETRSLPAEDWVRSHLHWCCAMACLESDDLEAGEPHLDDALALAERSQRKGEWADALCLRGMYRAQEGRWAEAKESHAHALLLNQSLHRSTGEVASLNGLAFVALQQGDWTAAKERYQAVVRLCRRIDDRRGLAVALNDLGCVAARKEDFAEAAHQFEACYAVYRELRDPRGVATSLVNLGKACDLLHRTHEAAPGLALAEALLHALREPEESPLFTEAHPLLARAAEHYGAESFALLRQGLARRSLSALVALDRFDPLTPPVRRLRLDSVVLTV